jgi:hypothetical protein
VNDWTWEYMPDAEHVVGNLEPEAKRGVERLAQRLADAASVRFIGDPPGGEPAVSRLRDHAEGRLIVWYLEHRALREILVVRVQYWPESDSGSAGP